MSILGRVKWVSLTLSFLVGCTQGIPEAGRIDKETALREWKRNEAILIKAIEGQSREDQLLESLIFFQKLTGISVQGDGTTVGYILDERAKDDLVKLQDWCKQHCHELYWDEVLQRVKRLPRSNGGLTLKRGFEK